MSQFVQATEFADSAGVLEGLDEVRSVLAWIPSAAEIESEYARLVMDGLEEDLFIRIAFSCLVDADAIDMNQLAPEYACNQMILLTETCRDDALALYEAAGFAARWTGFKKKL